MRVISWIKRNKLATTLLVIITIFVGNRFVISSLETQELSVPSVAERNVYYDEDSGDFGEMEKMTAPAAGMPSMPFSESAPTDVKDRLVIEESLLSLVVGDVVESVDKIIDHAEKTGGYMVTTTLTDPEDAAFASVVVRVPEDGFRDALSFFRKLSIKVSSENITGRDVTDEYVDIEARLETLQKTKDKFEEILSKAVKIDDILRVQRELINLQSQIDSLKGQQKFLEQSSKLAKITIYLSTDELSLPYTPSERFRPDVIFKTAVRSLLQKLQSLAGFAIWVGVYAIIWVPVGAVVIYLRQRRKKSS